MYFFFYFFFPDRSQKAIGFTMICIFYFFFLYVCVQIVECKECSDDLVIQYVPATNSGIYLVYYLKRFSRSTFIARDSKQNWKKNFFSR